ncbi:hypothetical protein [Halobacteriovorax sp.]|uniref:hypothetical protein n=1 Tax=Halobacteriovorax sp. TaxID=2020862 RepID=UPI003AF28E4A
MGTLISCSESSQKYNSLKLTKKFSKNTKDSIIIAYTGNLKSQLTPHKDELINGSKIEFGGAQLQRKYLSAIRSELGNILLIDGGQILAGQSKEDGDEVLEHINELEYDAVLLSDHDLISLKNQKNKEINIPFVNSNLLSLDTNESLSSFNNKEVIIKEINGVKVGIFGLTPYKPILKDEDGLEGILFDDVVARILNIKRKIKGQTDINIAILHAHDECSDKIDYRFKDCKIDRSFIKKILTRLPPDTIDIVFSGSSIEPVTKILEYPVVSNLGHGEFITLLRYFPKTKEIEAQQVRICSDFYDVTNSCYISPDDINAIKEVRKSRLKLRPAQILKTKILQTN